MLNKFLFKHIDNSALIVFRICFGFLITAEAWGAIMTGWVRRAYVDPQFTFNFIGFDFLQVFVGEYMYVHFVIMGFFGLGVMLGYKYRLNMLAYTIFWAVAYFGQKSSYNNHYYLLLLLCGIMALLPANRYMSIDAKQNPSIRSYSMPNWCRWILILQLFIVYTYGSIAKLYPDWLDASVIKIFMQAKEHYYVIGDLLQHEWMHYFIAYGGILFDGLAIPLLLYKPTRKLAFFASVFFHLFNSIVFQVGIFPYLALAFCLFFFSPETIRNIFLKKKPLFTESKIEIPNNSKPLLVIASIYFIVQIALPLRHHFFQDNVLWTEEGHRLSWRMMLRSKVGVLNFEVVDKETGTKTFVQLDKYLTKKQKRMVSTHPGGMWQFAQHLKKEYAQDGKDVEVYVRSSISVNRRPYSKYIDHTVDLAAEQWSHFKHSDWILPSNLDKDTNSKP